MTKPLNHDAIDRQHDRDLRAADPRACEARYRARMVLLEEEPAGLFERGLTQEEFIEPHEPRRK